MHLMQLNCNKKHLECRYITFIMVIAGKLIS